MFGTYARNVIQQQGRYVSDTDSQPSSSKEDTLQSHYKTLHRVGVPCIGSCGKECINTWCGAHNSFIHPHKI